MMVNLDRLTARAFTICIAATCFAAAVAFYDGCQQSAGARQGPCAVQGTVAPALKTPGLCAHRLLRAGGIPDSRAWAVAREAELGPLLGEQAELAEQACRSLGSDCSTLRLALRELRGPE